MNIVTKKLLEKITLAEQKNGEMVNSNQWRQKYHLMPPVGWLNDPNGLCYANGEYYVYFQYSPLDVNGGMKCWGLYKSKDLIHWTYEGTPLVPDEAFDQDGVYSGCAFVENHMIYLYYTGNVKQPGKHDYILSGREANTVLVILNNNEYSKKECIMTNTDYPKYLSCHVRDPKVWKVEDMYYMVQGARTKEDKGIVLLFESKDMKSWKFINNIESKEKFGYMWECPDLYEVDGKYILSISPQGVKRNGYDYANVYQSGFYMIEGDIFGEYELSYFKEFDRGFDFYAPQSFEDNKGRRIMIGWMGVPDCEYKNPTTDYGWQHCLTIPREISVIHNKLYQKPIEELKTIRRNEESVVCIESYSFLRGLSFECFLEPKDKTKDCKIIINKGLSLHYDSKAQLFLMEFSNNIGAGRTTRGVTLEELKEIRIFADASSMEVFLNGGEEVFTTRIYIEQKDYSVIIECEEAKLMIWNLEVS